MRTRTVAKVTTAFVLMFGLARANAIPMLRLTTDAGSDVTITDGGVGDISAAGDGVVVFSGWLAGWDINVTTGLSKPALGTEFAPILDLNSVNVSSRGAAGTINIWLTDTDFAPLSDSRAKADIGGTASGNVRLQTFFDDANVAFGQGHALTDQSFSSSPFSGSAMGVLSSLNPYSLTLLVSIFHDGTRPGQVSSFDATLVPEPSSLLLAGIGLFAMAFVMRRRNTATSLR